MKVKGLTRFCTLLLMIILLVQIIPYVFADDHIGDMVQIDEPVNKAVLTNNQLQAETSVLVNWLLAKHYAYDLIYFNTMDEAYDAMAGHYNIFTELESRVDADSLLFAKLVEYESKDIDINTESGVYDQLNLALLMLIMEEECYQNALSADELSVLETIISPSSSTLSSGYPESFWSEKTGVQFVLATYTYTKNGTRVPLYEAQSELTTEQINKFNSDHAQYHPNATKLADASSRYNCHAYAWYSTSSQYWANYVTPYVEDPHTLEVYDASTAEVGDIIVYYNSSLSITHSAVVESVSESGIYCISKWGEAGKYRHHIDDVPWSYYAGLSEPHYNVFYRENHRYYYKHSETSTNHTYKCYYCSATSTTSHTFVTTDNGDGTHTKKCPVCNWVGTTSNHIYTAVANTGGVTHTKTCKTCGVSITEMHNLDSTNSRCLTCGFTGPFSSIIMKKRIVPISTE